jgi:hypothetical protein
MKAANADKCFLIDIDCYPARDCGSDWKTRARKDPDSELNIVLFSRARHHDYTADSVAAIVHPEHISAGYHSIKALTPMESCPPDAGSRLSHRPDETRPDEMISYEPGAAGVKYGCVRSREKPFMLFSDHRALLFPSVF